MCLVGPNKAVTVECDEQRAFLQRKRETQQRLDKNPEVCGDRYCFTEIDRDSRLAWPKNRGVWPICCLLLSVRLPSKPNDPCDERDKLGFVRFGRNASAIQSQSLLDYLQPSWTTCHDPCTREVPCNCIYCWRWRGFVRDGVQRNGPMEASRSAP
jgi:hypothetical protein